MIAITTENFGELEINLPQAASDQPAERANMINIGITAAGNYMVNGAPVKSSSSETLSSALRTAAGERPSP